ncbi:MAG: hypothetical protein CM1200mP10_22240 [Candidatus Neomarinimicrobiota bacterium]|nr:MAG: hypothetical protein CM1200mP10_22240 [Candidatus Neomarinimicrobiota bacterium]
MAKDSAFVDGAMITYKSGVISDTSIDPGQTANFKIVIEKPLAPEVEYRTYAIRWSVQLTNYSTSHFPVW